MTERGSESRTWLIRGGRVVDPSAGLDAVCDVLVVDGRVVEVGRGVSGPPGCQVADAEGLWLWPGLVDLHVHFREPGFTHKETIATGSAAAVRGGYTCVVCEPNTNPALDAPGVIEELTDKAQRAGLARVYFKAPMTEGRRGERAADLKRLAAHDSVVAASDDGDPISRAEVMAQVCKAAAEVGLPLSPHCEDSPRSLADYGAGASPGFEPGEAYANEAHYIERDLEIAARAGCRIHFSHVSLAESVELIARHRSAGGAGVTFEVTPHHLFLAAEDYPAGRAPTVNPPLRRGADRDALVRAVSSGAADAIASDHAPHSAEDKARGATGVIGLETTLGLVLTHLVHTGALSALAAARLMSTRPAHVFGLPGGSLAVGRSADIVLMDPQQEWTVRSAEFASLSRNTPFEGRRLRGRAVATMVDGRIVYADDAFRGRMRER